MKIRKHKQVYSWLEVLKATKARFHNRSPKKLARLKHSITHITNQND